jgi:hypothetical protein
LAFFDGAKPNQRLSPFSVAISGFVHPRLVGPANQLAPSSSLVVFEKENRLWMSLTGETPAPGISAFPSHSGDRSHGQLVRRGQKADQATTLPLEA